MFPGNREVYGHCQVYHKQKTRVLFLGLSGRLAHKNQSTKVTIIKSIIKLIILRDTIKLSFSEES